MVRVKICGMTSQEDIAVAVQAGVHAIGFVFEPSSPRYVGDHPDLQALLQCIPPFVMRVAVFGKLKPLPEAVWQGMQAAQFVDDEESVALPSHLQRIRTVRLRSEEDVRVALAMATEFDALLVDAYHPQRLGGTGEHADWSLARLLREQCAKPVILAGGLSPENVCEAIAQVRPFAVDVSSGVEATPGRKDHLKIREFVANVQRFATAS